ncbi:outer membrane protein assembly factor BamE [Deltaproteobacteria bacterium TL4]
MKKWIILNSLLLGISISIGYNMVRYRYDFHNAILRTLMYFDEGTRYAPRFSEENFAKLRPKMTQKEVLTIMGEPLRKSCFTICEWVYTWQITDVDDYDRRDVIFSQSGIVERIRHEFYID